MNTNRRELKLGSMRKTAVASLCLLLPTLMGGCPEFRNDSVNAIETAARGIFDAAFDQLFEQLVGNEVS